jgi:hypothetical protein
MSSGFQVWHQALGELWNSIAHHAKALALGKSSPYSSDELRELTWALVRSHRNFDYGEHKMSVAQLALV